MKKKKEMPHNKNNRKEKINSFLNNLTWFLGIVFVLHEIIAPPIYKNNLLNNPKYAIGIIEYHVGKKKVMDVIFFINTKLMERDLKEEEKNISIIKMVILF